MAGGFHSTNPEFLNVALVDNVTSKLPSALQIKDEIIHRLGLYPYGKLVILVTQPCILYLIQRVFFSLTQLFSQIIAKIDFFFQNIRTSAEHSAFCIDWVGRNSTKWLIGYLTPRFRVLEVCSAMEKWVYIKSNFWHIWCMEHVEDEGTATKLKNHQICQKFDIKWRKTLFDLP